MSLEPSQPNGTGMVLPYFDANAPKEFDDGRTGRGRLRERRCDGLGYRAGGRSGDAVLRDALVSVASAGDRYLEAPDCSVAIAAAEAAAAARGHPSESLPELVAG